MKTQHIVPNLASTDLKPDDLRYEVKMVCDQSLLAQARSWVRMHPAGFSVAYPPRRVNSLYIDTPHLTGLNDNLRGLSLRQKLRLRWYGDEVVGIRPYLELKQKQNLLGRKERHLLPNPLDLTLPWTETLQVIRANAGPNWQFLLQTVHQPTLLNRYQREYYVTADGTIRVTLDFDQVAYDQRLFLRPNLRVRLPIEDTVVIEIKADQEHTERLQEIAGRFPLRRSRNSKYVGGLLTAMG
ncbi:MAG: polyphosphate polymerase domain-containing protein [Chloroflexi bacterium]|nr:polyphosphate polymerase domain-containing protein [Chloroflexota bacterium]